MVLEISEHFFVTRAAGDRTQDLLIFFSSLNHWARAAPRSLDTYVGIVRKVFLECMLKLSIVSYATYLYLALYVCNISHT
jgi:hypothetical protein